jgi:hypothetical protein
MYGVRYSAKVKGKVPRLVTCEQCGHAYGYWLERTGVGSASSYFGIGMRGGGDRAASPAEDMLDERLGTECDAVPCPSCGWYQEPMIEQARLERYGWLVRGGWLLFVLGVFGFVFGGCLVTALDKSPQLWGVARGFQLLAGLAVFAPLVGHLLKWQLAARYDPNADDVEQRKQRGRKRAMNPKEHDRLVPKPASEELPPKLRLDDFKAPPQTNS